MAQALPYRLLGDVMTYCQKSNTALFLSRCRKEDASPWRDYTKILRVPLIQGVLMS
jgi:hypothetical protein